LMSRDPFARGGEAASHIRLCSGLQTSYQRAFKALSSFPRHPTSHEDP
jgi:hypothetical protein